uniref:uncharacterized protein isoform X1 n=2 Tax=Myxine glutinosa TaxID=7769 RepID=UPI00358E1048
MPTLVFENVEFTLKVAYWSRTISVFCYNVANNALVSVPFCYLQIVANDAPVCIICKERGEKKRALKCFNFSNWETAKNAARRRKALQSDKFSNTSEEIRTAEGPEGKYYQSVCLSRFCAVKRGAPPSTEPSEPPQKTTRSSSDHLSTSTRGVLGQECIFCGQKRKRKLQKNEPLSQCLTTDGSKAILLAAKKKCDTRIIGHGEDLIAKEAKYHNSCRRDYERLHVTDEEQTSNRKMHVEAFKNLSMFLENEVIKNKTPMLASVIFNLYKEEFLALGGTQDDIDRYTAQSLISKIKERFPEILVDKRANKSGNLVFHSSLTSAEAFAMAYTCSDLEQETPAGLHLRNGLGTALAWDNYDVNTETPDDKNNLHSTVGICYQNQLPSEPLPDPSHNNAAGTLTRRKRRRFDGTEKVIPPFLASLKNAQFKLTLSSEYPGSSVPESLTGPHEDDGDGVEDNSVDEEESNNAWSEDSDESDESDREDL